MSVLENNSETDVPSDQSLKIAAVWKERLENAPNDSKLKERFTVWLNTNEMNKVAWSQICETNNTIRLIGDSPEILALRQEVISRTIARKEIRHQNKKISAIAAAVVIAIGGFVFFENNKLQITRPTQAIHHKETMIVASSPQERLYETGMGERIEIALEDGSQVTLDTQSRMGVNYTPNQRFVKLYDGRAMFDVAKDVERPFSVEANGRTVTALGTKFDVRSINDEFVVNLVEGRVKVESQTNDDAKDSLTLELEPGYQAVAMSLTDDPVISPADVTQTTSWQRGLLVFKNDSLQDAVSEMNRYSTTEIVLADTRTSQLRLSGAFKAGDNQGFSEALILYFPDLKQTEAKNKIVMSSDQ